MAHDYEQQELFHIRTMVRELERLLHNGDDIILDAPVMQPEYWRSRINALLARPAISRSIATDASVLLMKLDGIAAAFKHAS